MSPNGSMNTVVPSALSRKADWPYHSTCMLFLRSGCAQDAGRGGRVVVLVAAAAHERRERRYQAGHDRKGECLCSPVRNGAEMSCGKKECPVIAARSLALRAASA